MKKRPVIIDTDPGIDDAFAIVPALFNEKMDVQLISTVPGNVNVDLTTENALNLLQFVDVDIPVAKGAENPLIVELEDASYYHGETGLGGYEFPPLKRKEIEKNGIQAMAETILGNEHDTTILALGPLTNIALLLHTFPEVKDHIEQIIIMGGSLTHGNTTSIAEFNIYSDPHAAEMVFQSGLNMTMIGLNVTYDAIIYTPQIEKIQEMGEMGEMLTTILSYYRSGTFESGLRMHDSCTLAYFDDPSMFVTEKMRVKVLTDDHGRGATVVNLDDPSQDSNINVAVGIDVDKFQQWMVDSLQKAADTLYK